MRKCPHCGEENPINILFCKKCDRSLFDKQKPRKEVEYVQLYRGGKYMKKSSAKYFAKKDEERNKFLGVLLGLMLLFALILSQCS